MDTVVIILIINENNDISTLELIKISTYVSPTLIDLLFKRLNKSNFEIPTF